MLNKSDPRLIGPRASSEQGRVWRAQKTPSAPWQPVSGPDPIAPWEYGPQPSPLSGRLKRLTAGCLNQADGQIGKESVSGNGNAWPSLLVGPEVG
jgi:hypothetical protein